MRKKQKFTYLMTDGNLYKIGQSVNPKKRLSTLRTGNPEIELITYGKGVSEKYLHDYLFSNRVKLEWFNLNEAKREKVIRLINKGETTTKQNKKAYYGKSHGKKVTDGLLRQNRLNSNYTINFGKHRGRKMKDMVNEEDYNYCVWYIKQYIEENKSKTERRYKAFKWAINEYEKIKKEKDAEESLQFLDYYLKHIHEDGEDMYVFRSEIDLESVITDAVEPSKKQLRIIDALDINYDRDCGEIIIISEFINILKVI